MTEDFQLEPLRINTTMERSQQYKIVITANGKRKTIKTTAFDQASVFKAIKDAFGAALYHPAIEILYQDNTRDETVITLWDATLENVIGRGTLNPI